MTQVYTPEHLKSFGLPDVSTFWNVQEGFRSMVQDRELFFGGIVFGSAAKNSVDRFSDFDCLLVLHEASMKSAIEAMQDFRSYAQSQFGIQVQCLPVIFEHAREGRHVLTNDILLHIKTCIRLGCGYRLSEENFHEWIRPLPGTYEEHAAQYVAGKLKQLIGYAGSSPETSENLCRQMGKCFDAPIHALRKLKEARTGAYAPEGKGDLLSWFHEDFPEEDSAHNNLLRIVGNMRGYKEFVESNSWPESFSYLARVADLYRATIYESISFLIWAQGKF